MEDDKRRDRNLAKAEAARRLARLQRGRYWIGTEKLLTRQLHYNLVFLHARRQPFPNFADIALAIQQIWPWGEVASVEEVESRLAGQWPVSQVEASLWKMVADAAARGHLLLDLEQVTLDRKRPLALLPPNAPPLASFALPDTLVLEAPEVLETVSLPERSSLPEKSTTVDASALPELLREQFHRNLRAVELVLAGASQTSAAKESGISRSTLSRLVQRTRQMGQVACIPRKKCARSWRPWKPHIWNCSPN